MEPSQVSQANGDLERGEGHDLSAAEHGVGAFAAATGRQLEQRTDQRNYRRYQYDLIVPHCGGEILEVGAGSGDFSAQFAGRQRVILTDVDPQAVAAMGDRFADRPEISARQLDVATLTPQRAAQLVEESGPVDTVLAINVLEHIEDHVLALRALSALVRPGGNLVMWVPGYQQLYGDFDRSVGHVRRYTPKTLAGAAREAGLAVDLCRPVNLLGGIAWWAAVRKGGAGTPDPRLVKIYDTVVVPATRILDRLPIPFGQTILGSFTRAD
ncbi:bifunctional 2-polyprenyl-6-hydroxyphenol methylase/3-demethylubiquinol 3-O-methyltransferase UbiG [Microlunatus sp. Gsoil 973]|uniref:class I SAM-dependent methyltransferase n=1 Tax=Microlunatus sp. Gsoil 973 TaxID=2672569 RepID=UPI0012B4F70A|nr:class I SAM-dependent methyltransferase [Microlunatus sp. Gsoil 973]QGN31925.1 methyltransferase domain-containing protein [Microlunatus sp. Gsoil 973]